ncbi:MAG TPA: VOC family protein [Polyangiaceae bacterium]|nr:VOC family protein [Polyangiaceae bacterium]
MALSLGPIGQIAFNVKNADASEKFYQDVLGLRKLYRFGNLVFFDCTGLRLLLEQSDGARNIAPPAIYFRVADIALVYAELLKREVKFIQTPHLIAPMPDHDLWLAAFEDPDGHSLHLMMEAPKGYQLPISQ